VGPSVCLPVRPRLHERAVCVCMWRTLYVCLHGATTDTGATPFSTPARAATHLLMLTDTHTQTHVRNNKRRRGAGSV
jgi:hypothetical protein